MLINVSTCKFRPAVRLPEGDIPAQAGSEVKVRAFVDWRRWTLPRLTHSSDRRSSAGSVRLAGLVAGVVGTGVGWALGLGIEHSFFFIVVQIMAVLERRYNNRDSKRCC